MRSMRSAKKDIRSCSLSGQTGVRGYSLKTAILRVAVLETSILRVARGLCRSFCLQDPGFLEKWDLFEVFSCIDPFSGLNQGISDENGIQRLFFFCQDPAVGTVEQRERAVSYFNISQTKQKQFRNKVQLYLALFKRNHTFS